jgi:hypothetical protein
MYPQYQFSKCNECEDITADGWMAESGGESLDWCQFSQNYVCTIPTGLDGDVETYLSE